MPQRRAPLARPLEALVGRGTSSNYRPYGFLEILEKGTIRQVFYMSQLGNMMGQNESNAQSILQIFLDGSFFD